MTTADKTMIDNLLGNIKNMKVAADEVQKPYLDERVAKYAEDAMVDAKEVREYILASLNEHKEMLFAGQFKNMEIGGGPWGYQAVERLTLSNTLNYPISELVSLCFHVDSFTLLRDGGRDRIWINAPIEDVTIEDIYIHTSNTEKRAYHLGIWKDFVFKPEGLAHGTLDFRVLRTAKGWKALYEMANLKKEKSEFFLSEYKAFLEKRVAAISEVAKGFEKAKEEVKDVTAYVKVGL